MSKWAGKCGRDSVQGVQGRGVASRHCYVLRFRILNIYLFAGNLNISGRK